MKNRKEVRVTRGGDGTKGLIYLALLVMVLIGLVVGGLVGGAIGEDVGRAKQRTEDLKGVELVLLAIRGQLLSVGNNVKPVPIPVLGLEVLGEKGFVIDAYTRDLDFSNVLPRG